ncbi:ThiF family adenylyltransferase [Agromyces sp. G08B096]|uniref:ThiF family adenylyltransferase n=1 Tax=Agromyces sp. G08B096 TaxID=3156399 RepID=A0AAU7W5M6_9MICO
MSLPPLVEPADALPSREAGRTARQRRLPELGELGQLRLANARVLVLGAGGLGAPALTWLAAAGIGTIGIVDDDVVELSNLHRQPLHGVADLGRPKVDSAAEAIAALAPDAVIERHRLRLEPGNAASVLAGYDLVLDGTDTFETRYLVDDTCAELGLPLVWASVLRFDAQLSVFWARPPIGEGVRLRTLFPEPPAPGEVPSCAEAGVLGALCGQVGAMMAQEAVKLITGIGEPLLGRVVVIDALRGRQREIPLRPVGQPAAPVDADAPRTAAEAAAPAGPGAPSASAASSASASDPFDRIDAATLAARLRERAAGRDRFVLVDVREPGEHAEGAIDDAVLLPLGELLRDPAAARDRVAGEASAPLVVHCLAGARAERAALALARVGERVTVVDGGYEAWLAATAGSRA